MLRVQARLGDLRVGDRFTVPPHDPLVVLTLAGLPIFSDDRGTLSFETAEQGTWYALDLNLPVILHAGAGNVAARVAEALTAFDSSVIVEILRMFCATCGVQACDKHASRTVDAT